MMTVLYHTNDNINSYQPLWPCCLVAVPRPLLNRCWPGRIMRPTSLMACHVICVRYTDSFVTEAETDQQKD